MLRIDFLGIDLVGEDKEFIKFSVGYRYDYSQGRDTFGDRLSKSNGYLAKFDNAGEVVSDSDNSGDYGSGYVSDFSELDTAPGIARGRYDFSAFADSGRSPRSLDREWQFYDAALETDAQSIEGSTRNDLVLGGRGVDTIATRAGDDILFGGAGGDTLIGGAGNDTYIVDRGDVIIERIGGGFDTINAQGSYTLGSGMNVERLVAADPFARNALTLIGNSQSQELRGNSGGNRLEGRAGDDTLGGGYGNDTLIGGSGKDIYVFDSYYVFDRKNIDHITSFSVADDTIRIDHRAFYTLKSVGRLLEGEFKDITEPGTRLDADDRILYDHDSGRLWFDYDGSGAGLRKQFAILDNAPTLTFQDLQVI